MRALPIDSPTARRDVRGHRPAVHPVQPAAQPAAQPAHRQAARLTLGPNVGASA